MIEHDNVAGCGPWRCEEEWMVGVQLGCLGDKDVPTLKHGGKLIILRHSLEGISLLLLSGDAWSLWVDEQFSGSKRYESTVNMHSVLVLEVQHVDVILRTKVPTHPLNTKIISHLTALHEDVFSNASELGGVEHRFEFGSDELAWSRAKGSLVLIQSI